MHPLSLQNAFRARPPSKTESGRCENETFARDVPQKVKAEDVKAKLSYETSLKIWKWKMWKRSFRARRPSNFESSNCEIKLELAVPLRGRSENDPTLTERVLQLSAGQASLSGHVLSCKTQNFVHPLSLKNAFRCETSLKNWKRKMWQRSFCAKLPSKSESGRCENKAFVRDFPHKVKAEDVKTKLSCETSLKIWKWKMWKRSFRARLPYCDSDVWIMVILR